MIIWSSQWQKQALLVDVCWRRQMHRCRHSAAAGFWTDSKRFCPFKLVWGGIARLRLRQAGFSEWSLLCHLTVGCVVLESNMIREIITNLCWDNVPAVSGVNWEEKIVWSHLTRETTGFPFFHTQLHLLFQVHIAEHVHTETCTHTKTQPQDLRFLMGSICIDVN